MFQAEVASALESALESTLEFAVCVSWVEVYLFLWASSVSADFLRCLVCKEGIWA